MKQFIVTYSGNATNYKNFSEIINAESEREAVEEVYSTRLNTNYFPDDEGNIYDCDHNLVAEPGDNMIEYDGGCFSAEELTYDVTFEDGEYSNSKCFAASLEYCKDYIKRYNSTNESYFADYKGHIVQIVCNQTGEAVHAELIPE